MTHLLTEFPGLYNYWVVIVLMMTGLYVVMARSNLIKKLIGLNIFQVSVIMFYISMGKVQGGKAPVLIEGEADVVYSNPIPHVLMLTAIVVGIATISLALALVVRLHDAYGTIEEDEILAQDNGTAVIGNGTQGQISR